jgi:putative ABC transport system ATP-binding protein
MTNQAVIEAMDIEKSYRMGSTVLPVLKGVDMRVEPNEFVAIMGPSGSGKSTLLHILGCLDRPDAGSYHLDGQDVLAAADDELSRIRAARIGFVFQAFNLLPALSVFDNVKVPFSYARTAKNETASRVEHAVARVGLSHRIHHRPAELSGGELQRAAIARALVMEPSIILADEPTGNLDSQTGLEIMQLFQKLHQEGASIVMISHNPRVADFAQRVISLMDGRVIDP